MSTNLRDPEENRRYYLTLCRGDSLLQLDTSNYEWPRIDWLLRAVGSGLRVLDVGCLTGEIASMLSGQGNMVVGLDPSKRHVELARTRYPEVEFRQGFLEDMSLKELFEVVVAGDVLEHVPDPDLFIEEMRRRATSACVLTTPLGHWDSPEHIHVFTESDAERLVTHHGGKYVVIPDRTGVPRWLGLLFEGRAK